MGWQAHWTELTRQEQWAIGVVDAPIHAFLQPGFRPQVRWLAGPGRAGFDADPFGWAGPGGLEIFCESWDAARDLGRLAWLDPDGRAVPLVGFPEQLHHSYPYLIEDEGELYCVPECWQAGSVRLYRATRPPLEWTMEATLLPGVAAADPTLFQFEGRWWIAYSDQWSGPMSELWLWHAPALRGPWTPHLRNPVKTDLGSARPGGTPFWHDGALYRPAQDCRATYGAAIVIHRIERLTPSEFTETAVARVEPQPDWDFSSGLHNLAAAGAQTLLDAKRWTFLPPAFRRILRRKVRSLLTRA